MRKNLIQSTAITVAISLLAGCANVQQFANDLSARMASSQGMTATALPDNPCEENRRQQLSYGRAFLGGAIGAVGGAVAGALLGEIFKGADKNKLMAAGAVAGGAVGVKVGYDAGLDTYSRQCELYKVVQAKKTDAAFATLQQNGKLVGELTLLPSQRFFEPGSADLTSEGRDFYRGVASQYTPATQLKIYQDTVNSAKQIANQESAAKNSKPVAQNGALPNVVLTPEERQNLQKKWDQMRIVLTGHTDDSLAAEDALAISEQRAIAVAMIFKNAGVPEQALMYQGAGSAFPIADNATEKHGLNNRVDVAVVYQESAVNDLAEAQKTDYTLLTGLPPRQSVSPKVKAVEKKPSNVATAATRINTPSAQSNQNPRTNVAKNTENKSTTNTRPATASSSVIISAGTQASAPNNPNFIDFAGASYSPDKAQAVAKLGKPKSLGLLASLSFPSLGIGEARASQGGIPASCADDSSYRYNVKSGEIKRLGSGASMTKSKTNIDHNDLYWHNKDIQLVGDVGSHLVVVTQLMVKTNGQLLNAPVTSVFKSYSEKAMLAQEKDNGSQTLNGQAVTLLGDGGLLLRQFFTDTSANATGVRCMDLLLPNVYAKQVAVAKESYLLYNKGDGLMLATAPLRQFVSSK